MKESSCYIHREMTTSHEIRVWIKCNTVMFPYRDEVEQALLHLAFGQADNLHRLTTTASLCAGGVDTSTTNF